MAFVFYDTETTGLNTRYDQILSFAAVKTDDDLNELDRLVCSCRLMPHVVPHPIALHVNGITLEAADDPSLPSHYQMMRTIQQTLEAWSPALFIGYNSISFDEEVLRHALYLTLHNPYLTSMPGNGRADALALVRTIAFLRPGALTVATRGDGATSFKLADICEANGIGHVGAHRAINDVLATIALCKKARDGDDETWSRFLRSSTKSAVRGLLEGEDAVLHVRFSGNTGLPIVIVPVAQDPSDANCQLCLPIDFPAARFMALSEVDAGTLLFNREQGLVRIKLNKGPVLCPLYEAPEELLGGRSETQLLAEASMLRGTSGLAAYLLDVLQSQSPPRQAAVELEDMLYGRLPDREDEHRLRQFHAAGWEERPILSRAFNDSRNRAVARRLIYLERPDLCDPVDIDRMHTGLRRRLVATETESPWRTVAAALGALEELPSDIQDRARSAYMQKYGSA
jgi:exodeoxyribonuclease-1